MKFNFKTNPLIEIRLEEFAALNQKENSDWFSELCFCILTANSQAKKAIELQQMIGADGFLSKSQDELSSIIRSHGHRFHNNKSKFIVEARKHRNIKDLLLGLSSEEARDFLVKSIKGIGYKEASHFLRNVGYNNVAIIDRHVLRFLKQEKLISEIPKTITPKKYLAFEKILSGFAIEQSRLDLIIWYEMTGQILK